MYVYIRTEFSYRQSLRSNNYDYFGNFDLMNELLQFVASSVKNWQSIGKIRAPCPLHRVAHVCVCVYVCGLCAAKSKHEIYIHLMLIFGRNNSLPHIQRHAARYS